MSEKTQNEFIEVDGGYKPAQINLKQGVPATITFKRTSDKGCLDVVHSKDLNFEEALPLAEEKTISIDTDKAGEYGFSCGMDMFFGKVVVE